MIYVSFFLASAAITGILLHYRRSHQRCQELENRLLAECARNAQDQQRQGGQL